MAKPHPASWRPALRLFQLFGHPIRAIIFQRLARQPMSAGELAKTLPVSRTAVVQHLGLLKQAGLVDRRAEGRRQLYHVTPHGLAPLRRWLDLHMPSDRAK